MRFDLNIRTASTCRERVARISAIVLAVLLLTSISSAVHRARAAAGAREAVSKVVFAGAYKDLTSPVAESGCSWRLSFTASLLAARQSAVGRHSDRTAGATMARRWSADLVTTVVTRSERVWCYRSGPTAEPVLAPAVVGGASCQVLAGGPVDPLIPHITTCGFIRWPHRPRHLNWWPCSARSSDPHATTPPGRSCVALHRAFAVLGIRHQWIFLGRLRREEPRAGRCRNCLGAGCVGRRDQPGRYCRAR